MEVGTQDLTIRDVVQVARAEASPQNSGSVLTMGRSTYEALDRTRALLVAQWLHNDSPPAYGVTTGLGALQSRRANPADSAESQLQIISDHCVGIGAALSADVVRAAMLLRAHSLATNHSGVRPCVVERLVDLLNAHITPVVPEQGSVGASGDLAPQAYIAAAMIGHPESRVMYQGAVLPADEALSRAGLAASFHFEAKETLSLINGSTVSAALAAITLDEAALAMRHADVALAVTLEAVRGHLGAFDERIHNSRPHRGQIASAANVRMITEGTSLCTPEARRFSLGGKATSSCRVQDAYSLRCAPQVHGPVREAIEYATGIINVELNSATDNPLVFLTDDTPNSGVDVLSGGNFHGQYLAQAMDLLSMALTDAASISERRVARLLDPMTSYGLPTNLTVGSAPRAGLSIAHSTASAVVAECRTLCGSASADSIPTKNNQEDHISNSMWCARKASMILRNLRCVLAIEMLAGAQAHICLRELMSGRKSGRGTEAALNAIERFLEPRASASSLLHGDIAKMVVGLMSDRIVRSVEERTASVVL